MKRHHPDGDLACSCRCYGCKFHCHAHWPLWRRALFGRGYHFRCCPGLICGLDSLLHRYGKRWKPLCNLHDRRITEEAK